MVYSIPWVTALSPLWDKPSGLYLTASAVAEHAISSGQTIAWDEALVIDSNPHLHPRYALEAWHIRSQPHPLDQGMETSPQRMTG